ncbi:MAG: hypothetical protein GF416_08770 [Candidatus Altiarchaeales archaeon]|nr:hypothetical protein [Candidatus Altiarchaeales archaeon]MBD3417209.1 hypothetical protein [Candidatus Altiarchaeales archaeon]
MMRFLLLSVMLVLLSGFAFGQAVNSPRSLESAKMFMLRGECDNATRAALDAREYYTRLYEEEMRKSDQPCDNNAEVYADMIDEVNEFIVELGDICDAVAPNATGDEYYAAAQQSLEANELEAAVIYANKAMRLYVETQDYEGIHRIEAFLNKIRDIPSPVNPEEYMRDAIAKYNTADFEAALSLASNAKSVYKFRQDGYGISRADSLLSKIMKAIERYEEANDYYGQALYAFEDGDHLETYMRAKRAHSIYLELNDTYGVMESERLMESSGRHIEVGDSNSNLQLFFLLALSAVSLYLVFLVANRNMKFK